MCWFPRSGKIYNRDMSDSATEGKRGVGATNYKLNKIIPVNVHVLSCAMNSIGINDKTWSTNLC